MKTGKRTLLTLVAGLAMASASAEQVGLDVSLSRPNLVAGKKHIAYLKVSLKGFAPAKPEERAPVNVALVIDESGSMNGEKIEKAKEAAIMAVQRLGVKDVVSIVSYDSTVNVLVPATRLSDKESVIQRIRQLKASGNTALYAGVSKGAAEVRKFLDRNRVNRAILISDGQANVGPSSPGELAALGRALIKDGISVSTIGLGLGYNEDVMTQLAAASDGNHDFAENAEALTTIFNREFDDVLSVVAQEVAITITCTLGVRPVKVLGRDAEIVGQTVSAGMNQLYGNQEKYLLLEVEVPPGTPKQILSVATVKVSYANMATKVTDQLASIANLSYTTSEDESKESVNKKVMISVVSQLGNYSNIQAVELRDKGQVKEAQELLEKNAQFLLQNGEELNSEELKRQSIMNDVQKKSLNQKDWIYNRKQMRAQQHRTSMQQAEPTPEATSKSKSSSKASKK